MGLCSYSPAWNRIRHEDINGPVELFIWLQRGRLDIRDAGFVKV